MSKPLKMRVIGGRTGSGKTGILHHLEGLGEQVIDLEGLAKHKGSAFGALGESEQPSTEQFENNLAQKILRLDRQKTTWIEDESRNIGKCVLPGEFYAQMRQGELFFLDISREERAKHLVVDYARYDPDDLKACVSKIAKRLGGDRTREAIESIERRDFHTTAMITLHYYDKAYMYSLEKNHESYQVLGSEAVDPAINAELLVEYEKKRRL
jgi:tRNA 2-selenouridine synthase